MKRKIVELKELRVALYGNYDKVAKMAGVSVVTVSRILNNKPHAHQTKLKVLAIAIIIKEQLLKEKQTQQQQIENIIT